MDPVKTQHEELAAGRWAEMTFPLQMANIGSEVSRTIKWKKKGRKDRMEKAAFRALELFELSIDAAQKEGNDSRLRELCRAKEEFCNYAFDGEEIVTEPDLLIRYYDQFAMMTTK